MFRSSLTIASMFFWKQNKSDLSAAQSLWPVFYWTAFKCVFSFMKSQLELSLASIRCSLCGANGWEKDSLSVCFLSQDRKPIFFFSHLKSLWPSREKKKKDDSEIVRSWKDAQVLTIRVAASFPNLEGDREEQRHGRRVSFCVADGAHEGCLSLRLKTLHDP